MNIIIQKLIYQNYSNDEIMQKCSPTKVIIADNQEKELLQLQPSVIEYIQNGNLVVAYRHNETHKDYGYICFSIQEKDENNLYTITNIILDEKLEENPIRSFVTNTIEFLLNTIADPTRKDYIEAKKRYPLCQWAKTDTIKNVCAEVISQWKVAKEGITSDRGFMENLRKIGEKMK